MSAIINLITLTLGTTFLILEWLFLLQLTVAVATRTGPYQGWTIANVLAAALFLGGPAVIEIGTLLGVAIYEAVKNRPARRTLIRLNVLIWAFVVADTFYIVFFAGAFGMFM